MLDVVQAILYHTCWTYILIHVYTRGETTSGAKRLGGGGAKRPGGKRPEGKRLGGETTRGGNGLGAKRPGFVSGMSGAHIITLETVITLQFSSSIYVAQNLMFITHVLKPFK